MIYIISVKNIFNDLLNENVCFGNSKIDKMIFPELIDDNVVVYKTGNSYYDQKYCDIGYYNGFRIIIQKHIQGHL